MKKILVASLASVMAIGLAPGAVMAAEDNISNTGPGSFNWVYNEVNKTVDITCDNDIDVVTVNNQQANSGTASVKQNTYSGNATSGNAENFNQNVTDVDVSCGPKQAEAVTPPAEGGKGGGTPEPTPVVEAASTELPDTGASMVVVGAATALVLGTASALATKKLLSDEN